MSSPDDIPWWKTTTVYQIYPRSFADSNGDGIGDLQGILDRLGYLAELGVETLWLSPFFESAQADFGYDVTDYLAIAPEYGTLETARRLIREVHARGMKIVFDMVLNHTSDQHPWFVESRRSREGRKRDWYIWRDGRNGGPPNNWKSVLGGSGWHLDEATGQYYWASFLPFQPDLNYRNPEVKCTMLGVVRHWLREGVDGFRLDIFNAIFKDDSFRDNPFSFRLFPSEDAPDGFFQRYVNTLNHPDTFAFARELRALVDEFADPPRMLVGEVFGNDETLRRYLGERADGLNMVFLFKTLRTRLTAASLRELVTGIERSFPEPYTPTYVFGNHDRPRFIHRLGGSAEKGKLLAAFQLTVRGVPFIYYGEEIGMLDREIPLADGLDPIAHRFRAVPQFVANFIKRFGVLLNRDECRLPMQWDAGLNAGFTSTAAAPWLPVHPSATTLNVASQDGDPGSLLNCYRRLLALRRQSRALQIGTLELVEAPSHVVAYRRRVPNGDEWASVFINASDRKVTLDLRGHDGQVAYSTRGGEAPAWQPEAQLERYEAIVIVGGSERDVGNHD